MRTKEYKDNYILYSTGKVFSKKKNRFLVPLNNGDGYFKVNIWYAGVSKQEYIHKLIADAFLENTNNHRYIDHIDRDKTNNDVSNLRWCSASDNTRNLAGRPRYTVSKKGNEHHSNEIKVEVRRLFASGLGVMEISRALAIPRQSVTRFIKESH